ncbi:MAG: NAD-dependent epimerase/dehydratase family protein [Chitinophagaceae bacterium]|nr:NAD-dependent epimerase/dehydratase family protein [Chitinophagaceae bacterium]
MRIVIIGGTGHIGTYLVPSLVKAGHEVICVSRQLRKPYHENILWDRVKMEVLDRDALEENGLFGKAILALSPDIVIDMICFTLQSAKQIIESLRGKVRHFLHCGTMWVHGHSVEVPTSEDQSCNPFGAYGMQKAAIEKYLLEEYRRSDFPVTILHPGHIVGPGWTPLNPAGNFNPAIYEILKKGGELLLPNFGMETVHHVHAADVAQAFRKAIKHRKKSIGESFHIVSPKAITLRGYAESIAKWYGQTANLKFVSWEDWKKTVSDTDAQMTWDHISHSPNGSIRKAKKLIKYAPEYTSLQAIQEALQFMSHQEVLR